MDQDVFTAGIERGGLTTDYEVRMLICWLLYKIKSPVTLTQLNFALQQDGLVNYFALTRAVSQLLTSGHLVSTRQEPDHEPPMTVTDLGLRTAMTFEKNLPLTVRQKALSAARECLLRERLEKENHVSIEPTTDGWRIALTITDVSADLLSMSLYVPTRELCEAMKHRFLSDPTTLYRACLGALMGEELDASPLRDEEPVQL
ncbi:MAG: DUF4364 family protein [Oscillospiraceae bacterium]